jgi:aminopeptidase N
MLQCMRRGPVAGFVIAACGSPAAGPAGPAPLADPAEGVSIELARHRAATLGAVRYDLHLDVRGEGEAEGEVVIGFDRTTDAGDLVLDFAGLRVGRLRVNGAEQPARWRRGHLLVPAPLLRSGRNEVAVTFAAGVAAAGASIIRYDDRTDGATYLYTLLVPADAHRLFPSFDQPDLKARVRLAITAPADWTVVANGRESGREAVPGGVRWTFRETAPISTYLIAFAAGPWTAFAAGPWTAFGDSVRLFARSSIAAHVDADTFIALNLRALSWLEAYFGIAYPFDKLDLVLAPAFPFGGMEHVGAIFYNESRFVFREPPTTVQRLGRAATIYHEIAHQWFGDLVTMRWFDDLWLKEGFSTFVAAKIQEELEPESGAWKTFHLRTRPPAYVVDASSGTTPVWQELSSLELAKSNYGPIVYNKAPAILKQLEFLVGEAAFRSGMSLFLRRHAFDVADWRDLLAAIGEAAGRDLTPFGEHYILRAGIPIIETVLDVADGRIRELALVQRPARELPGDRGGPWPGRTRVLVATPSGDRAFDVELAGTRTVVAAAAGMDAPHYVLPNHGDVAYGIFLPDARSAEWLLGHAGTIGDALDRAVAWSGLWDLVREGRVPPGAFVASVLAALPREADAQLASSLLARAIQAIGRYTPPGPEREDRAAGMEQLLLAFAQDTTLPYDRRKEALDALLANARTPAGTAAMRGYLDGSLRFDGEPLGQPSRWAAVRRLIALGVPDGRALLAAETGRDTTPEGPRMAFIAGAAVPDAAVKASYFQRFFDDDGLNEEWVTASLDGFNEPLHAELTLPFLRPALERSEWLRDNRRIFFLPTWIGSFVGSRVDAVALTEVDRFLAERPALAVDVRRRVLQARDELERAVRLREARPR